MNLKRFGQYLLKSFLLIFLISTISLSLIIPVKAALIISTVFGILFGLFAAGHIERTMEMESFTINSSNKNPTLGLQYYFNEMDQYLMVMRYSKEVIGENLYHYTPRPRLRVMGGNVEIKKTAYEIEVKAPTGVVRILKSQLDLEKIFL